ncbi:MAG: hypothetical protein RBU29_05270 [bacterium]|jgi:hypothetical protein|nr:hypothetical protein [bacterium]
MERLLTEEEQISLLGKMLYYSVKHLTTREREIYDQLVEHLMRKVNQLRTLERIKSANEEEYSPLNAQLRMKKDNLRQKRVEEVCRLFVDAWNKQDFESEFFCLSQSFPLNKRKTDDVHEYVLQRMKKYQDRHKIGPINKKIIEISGCNTHGNKSSVYCIEIHKMPDRELTLHRQYDFIFEDGAWRIADYNTIKSHESSTTP